MTFGMIDNEGMAVEGANVGLIIIPQIPIGNFK